MTSQKLGDFPFGTLCDRYEVQQQLSKKAGRQTLLACDIQTQEPVIVKLLSTKDSSNRPYLMLWAGMHKYELSNSTNFTLTNPEVDWLAHELSDWLGLPIIRE